MVLNQKSLCIHLFSLLFFPIGLGFACGTERFVSVYDIDNEVRSEASRYVAWKLGVQPETISHQLKSSYELKVQEAKVSLLNAAVSTSRTMVAISDIQDTVRRYLDSFIREVRGQQNDVMYDASHIDVAVGVVIKDYMAARGVSQSQLSGNDYQEFKSRSDTILGAVRRQMNIAGRLYLERHEIERIVNEHLEVFVKRVRHQPHTNSSWSDWSDLFSWSTTSHNSSNVSSTSDDAKKIKRYQLDDKAQSVAYAVLKTYNLTPDTIPARVVSDFSQKVQKAIKRARDKMAINDRDFVWKDELEQIMLEELQSVVDKVNFKHESCAICLDDYTSGQRIGILPCGHVFHKDCIYRWFEEKKVCPICSAENVIVEKIETVP